MEEEYTEGIAIELVDDDSGIDEVPSSSSAAAVSQSSKTLTKRKKSPAEELMMNAFKRAISTNSWIKDDSKAFMVTGKIH